MLKNLGTTLVHGALAVLAIGALIAAAPAAKASVVTFGGTPALTFADGTFSSGLSGDYPDGFYGFLTQAVDGYGQNGEAIYFTNPAEFNSVDVASCTGCGFPADNLTVSLYDAASNLLASQTATGLTSAFDTLVFNTNGVSSVVFTFSDGADIYRDGRIDAWYYVNNVTYGAGVAAVPAPGALLLLGFGLIALVCVRRQFQTL